MNILDKYPLSASFGDFISDALADAGAIEHDDEKRYGKQLHDALKIVIEEFTPDVDTIDAIDNDKQIDSISSDFYTKLVEHESLKNVLFPEEEKAKFKNGIQHGVKQTIKVLKKEEKEMKKEVQ